MSDSANNAEALIGRTLDGGRYEVVDLIGEGGMGRVYKARQVSMDRAVALKLLRAQMAADESLLARFQQEALSVSRLRHPNTITVFDFGKTEDGYLFIAMELLGGSSLADILADDTRLPLRRALHIIRQVAGAVGEAHQMGVVHRDLKPENIQVDHVGGDPDFVKVLDFGIAKIIHGEAEESLAKRSKTLTLAGTVFGTPHYMSPEQVHGHKVDHRTDIYALGCILYELLAGEPPFNGSTPMSVMMAQASRPVPDLLEEHPDAEATPTVTRLIKRCMEKKRETRIQSCQELIQAIDEAYLDLSEAGSSINRLMPPGHMGSSVSGEARLAPASQVDESRTDLVEMPAHLMESGDGVRDSGPNLSPRQPTVTPDHRGEVASPPSLTAEARALEAFAQETRPRAGLWLGVAAAMVVIGIGGYLAATQGGDEITDPEPAPATQSPDLAPKTVKVDGSNVEFTLNSRPQGATVKMGDAVLGTTPFTHTWPASKKPELTFMLEGYEPYVRVLDVGHEASRNIEIVLTSLLKPSLKTRVESSPPGAEVFRGKARLGKTPFDWEVESPQAAESVQLRFSLKGHDDLNRMITLDPAQAGAEKPPVVTVNLSKAEPAKPNPGSSARRRRGRRRGGHRPSTPATPHKKPQPQQDEDKPPPKAEGNKPPRYKKL